jgi:DNA polymerase-3 subunit delta'
VTVPDGEQAWQDLANRAGGSVRSALLLTLHGGLEITQTVDALVSAPDLDVATAQRLGDVLAGREGATQLAIFNENLLERLSSAARQAASSGEGAEADRLAAAWEEAGRRIGEADAFNLDKKQHVIAMVELLRRHLGP